APHAASVAIHRAGPAGGRAARSCQSRRMAPTPITDGRPIRWGILGAGWIADTVSNDIALTGGNVVTAVAARDADRAERFATRHGAARSYGDYTSLVNDDEVDVV